jgi:hypothetical protein
MPQNIPSAKICWKVLALIFWAQDSILPIDYLPKAQTINAEYYSSLLVQLKDILKEKRSGKMARGILLLHENARLTGHMQLSVLITDSILRIWPRRTTTCSLD